MFRKILLMVLVGSLIAAPTTFASRGARSGRKSPGSGSKKANQAERLRRRSSSSPVLLENPVALKVFKAFGQCKANLVKLVNKGEFEAALTLLITTARANGASDVLTQDEIDYAWLTALQGQSNSSVDSMLQALAVAVVGELTAFA